MASHNPPPVWPAAPATLTSLAGAWNSSAAPCHGQFWLWVFEQNRAYAQGHGHAFYYARTAYRPSMYRRVQRSAKWFKLPAILGLLESGQHARVVYVDLDVAFVDQAPRMCACAYVHVHVHVREHMYVRRP